MKWTLVAAISYSLKEKKIAGSSFKSLQTSLTDANCSTKLYVSILQQIPLRYMQKSLWDVLLRIFFLVFWLFHVQYISLYLKKVNDDSLLFIHTSLYIRVCLCHECKIHLQTTGGSRYYSHWEEWVKILYFINSSASSFLSYFHVKQERTQFDFGFIAATIAQTPTFSQMSC